MKKLSYVLIAVLFVFTANPPAQELQKNNLQNTTDVAVASEMLSEAVSAKKVTQTFDVRIELVDERSGQPVDPRTLPGYAARNLDTNQLYYPGYYDYNEFYDLPAGTYRFDSYDGYFDGSSSEVVTLSSSLEGNDGFIVVTLRYWSE